MQNLIACQRTHIVTKVDRVYKKSKETEDEEDKPKKKISPS